MSKVPTVFVGIDYHQNFSSICVLDKQGKVLATSNVDSSADYLVSWLKWQLLELSGKYRVKAAIEACGGASELTDQLRLRGWEIDLAHSGYVSQLKKGPDKTDKQDAHLLADLVRVGYVPTVWLAPERLRQLRSLVRHRQRLAAERRATKLQIRALMRESGMKIGRTAWTKAWLLELNSRKEQLGGARAWIVDELLERLRRSDRDLRRTERKLEEFVADDAVFKKLRAQQGVGLVTAVTLRAEIGDFRRFRNGKRLARYCGTAPVNHSTGGNSRELGLGRQCNGELRRTIIETAHRLCRYVPRWKQMKADLRRRGKSGAEAAAAVANRWIRWLHHQMIQEEAEGSVEEAGEYAAE